MMQSMMTGLQEQSRQNMEHLAGQQVLALREIIEKVNAGNKRDGGDVKGIGKPGNFDGKAERFDEWKAKLIAYLRLSTPGCQEWIEWAKDKNELIDEDDVKNEYLGDYQKVLDFGVKIYSVLLALTEGDAFRIVHSVQSGNGLEAIRVLWRRYEPKTPGTKRAVLKAILAMPTAKKPEEVEKILLHSEGLMRKYECMSNYTLPDDLKVNILLEICPKDFREHLEVATKDKDYKEVRDEVYSYIERKRELFGNQLKAMEVDNAELKAKERENENMNNWGGDMYAWDDNFGPIDDELNYWNHKGGKKGYNNSWNSKGKGKNGYQGGGAYKGKGEGEHEGASKGKGEGGGGFQGSCHWCGEWGHSQSRCRAKDTYMEGVRQQGKGQHQGGQHQGGGAYNVEPEQQQHRPGLEALEYQRMSRVEWPSLCRLECNNAYSALEDNEQEEQHMNIEEFKEFKEIKYNKVKMPNVKRLKAVTVAKRRKKMELNCMCARKGGGQGEEVYAVNNEQKSIWITVDSGASENVIAEKMAPMTKTRPSRGSQSGVQYVTANGSCVKNQGEKHLKVVTQEGQKCTINMQVTDVQKPLMSVSRICDAGHRVVFTKEGGYIENLMDGKRTTFPRVDNVYRLKVDLAEEQGFSGPAK